MYVKYQQPGAFRGCHGPQTTRVMGRPPFVPGSVVRYSRALSLKGQVFAGGAWPFLVGGVICLLNCDNERDLNLLNSQVSFGWPPAS